MKLLRVTVVLVAALVALMPSVRLGASDLSGVYTIVQKVVLEPAEGTPERIQVWGAFVYAYGGPSRDAQVGYMYFKVPAKAIPCTTCSDAAAPANARREWQDLKSLAGSGQGVGFGARGFNPRVRPAGEKPDAPEDYPVFLGLVKIGNDAFYGPIVDALKKALERGRGSVH